MTSNNSTAQVRSSRMADLVQPCRKPNNKLLQDCLQPHAEEWRLPRMSIYQ